MDLILRQPTDRDWPAILALADRASPWKSKDNPAWLENRKERLRQNLLRFHLLAEGENGKLIGYAVLEAGERRNWQRIFLVVTPARLADVGEALYQRLEQEIQAAGLAGVWLREEPEDAELLEFFAAKGFVETTRGQIPDGLVVVQMEKSFQSAQIAADQFSLRRAQALDAPEIRRLVREGGINPTGLKWPRFVVVENGRGEVVACGQLKKHIDGSVELASLVVRQDQRGAGLARMVIEALVARQPGSVHLMCRSDLGPFYEKFGFRRLEVNEMPPYFRRLKRLTALFEKLAGREMLLVMLREKGRRGRPA